MASSANLPQSIPQIGPDRLEFLKSVAPAELATAFARLPNAGGPALHALDGHPDLSKFELDKLRLGHAVAELSDQNSTITGGLLRDPKVATLREVAAKYDDEKLAALFNASKSTALAATPPDEIPTPVLAFQRKLFHHEPSAVVARIVKDDEIPVGIPSTPALAATAAGIENPVRDGVVKFFENKPDFNIRQTSVTRIAQDGEAMKGIPDNVRHKVIASLMLLQTTQALTHTPAALPGLVKSGLTTAHTVTRLPETQFVTAYKDQLGGASVARDIHVHATNVVIRNELALTQLLQTVRGTGVATLDGTQTRAERIAKAKEIAHQQPQHIDLESLFGTLDVCACDDCESVSSPAAYFVELLQYLRNNTLDPDKQMTGHNGFDGTPLEILLRRRPDLADLELTCANTNTVLPYIDLANEVMESFIVHIQDFASSNPHQAVLDVFNADTNKEGLGGSSPELLAQPQNTNDKAYCILKSAVYPSTKLPFHQPVEAIRIYLDFLQTNRADLGQLFRKPYTPPKNTVPDPLQTPVGDGNESEDCESSDSCDSSSESDHSKSKHKNKKATVIMPVISEENRKKLSTLHDVALSRADDAERLLMTEEEYIIITKEAFWTKEYFDIQHGLTPDHATTDEVYQDRIGVRKDYAYWGYASEDDMKETTNNTGLTFIKLQFLPRSGLVYSELADLLRTDFINPNMPKGRNQVILQSFRFTYRLMQALAPLTQPGGVAWPHKSDRWKRLVDFLLNPQWRLLLKQLKLKDTASIFEKEIAKARHCHHHKSKCEDPKCSCRKPPKCRHHHLDPCQCQLRHAITRWLCKYFDKIGEIIVIDSNFQSRSQERFLGFEGDVVKDDAAKSVVGHLNGDGKIVKLLAGNAEEKLGTLRIDGLVSAGDDHSPDVPWYSKYGSTSIVSSNATIGRINESSAVVLNSDDGTKPREGSNLIWTAEMGKLLDDCDITEDRLKHLDGTPVEAPEYGRMHRFIRLWRKLGWTMIELDVALHLLGVPKTTTTCPPKPPTPPDPTTDPALVSGSNDVDWTDFLDDCKDGLCKMPSCKRCQHGDDNTKEERGRQPHTCGCHHCCHHRSRSQSTCSSRHDSEPELPSPETSPEFLKELMSLKKLAEFTGLTLLNLLAFWGPIATAGSPSLYSQLFLTHNLLGIDQVFKADENLNYLAASPAVKMADHIYILLAAFGLKIPGYAALVDKLWPAGGQDLTIDTVSKLYRYVLLSRVLGVKPESLDDLFRILTIDPFSSAAKALELVELWNTISEAGFSFPQLRYVLDGTEDPLLPPVGPSLRTMLQAATAIYTGLNEIDTQHPNIANEDGATSAVVLANVQLLFSPDVAAKIAGFLDGTLTFQIKGPKGVTLTVTKDDSTLAVKLKYADGDQPSLQTTGQLTEDEKARAKRWTASAEWATAIDRLGKVAGAFMKETLSAVFPPDAQAAAKTALLVGDMNPAPGDTTPNATATGPSKRFFFLGYFVPFLRRKLAEKLIVETMAPPASLDLSAALPLLKSIITDGTGSSKVTAMQSLQAIKNDPSPTSGFDGYFIPETTDTYTLVAESASQPSDIMLDSFAVPFSEHSPDDEPPDLWASKPLMLTGGKLYKISTEGILPKDLYWKTDRTQRAPIPASALLASHVTDGVKRIFSVLFKCAIIVNAFSLTADEVVYFQEHSNDFSDGSTAFDWNKPSLPSWKRLAAYTKIRNDLPKLGKSLIDLFKWMNGADAAAADTKGLAHELNAYTLWAEEDVSRLIDASHFNISKSTCFLNEINLIKLKKAIDARNKIGVDIDLLFLWAQPRIDFWKMRDIRDSVRKAIRAQFKLSDWEVAIKPSHDKLRQLQSGALTAYLINQPALKQQNVVEVIDADSLFEFFLIDNQMCPCMETARLKQATSSVQLFVQRCMLGLEPDVQPDALDRGRWNWMSKYRVWEANRKVFLYPENWIQPSLRDDKSPIYLQLESELHQHDLDSDSVLDAIKEFLFRLDEIGNLEVNAIYFEDSAPIDASRTKPAKIHIFARTRTTPYKFYYRMFDLQAGAWQPWQDMTVDIPRYEVEKPKKQINSGGDQDTAGPSMAKPGGFYVVPFTFNSRLMVAIPQFQKVQLPAEVPNKKIAEIWNSMNADESNPTEIWEIKMGLSELRKGRWTVKQVTSDAITEPVSDTPPTFPTPLPSIGTYKFIARRDEENHQVHIDAYRLVFPATTTDPSTGTDPMKIGRFTFTGSHFGKGQDALDVDGHWPWSDFHFQGAKAADPDPNRDDYTVMYPIQTSSPTGMPFDHEMDVYVKDPSNTIKTSKIKYAGKPQEEAFHHPFIHDLLDRVSRTDDLDDLFCYFSTGKVGDNSADAYGAPQPPPGPNDSTPIYSELFRPYSLYNWELGFHAPMAIVDRLLQNQQFDLALKMIHYVFDPQASGAIDATAKRCWKWPPFHDANSVQGIKHIFDSLEPNTPEQPKGHPDGPITTWRKNPFNPHVVARLRPAAYMKFVVMKYIAILIAYGDYYFRQNTLESIPTAIQCYVLASHVYGKPAQKIPKRGDKQVQTYRSLLNQWDAFSNAMVQMEVLFPFSINQIPAAVVVTPGGPALANIFGFATTQYFCIPDNPDLRAVRDTIDDRLFKIRHCQDIQGVERRLPLYEPPIDPGLLVAATAAGLSLSSVLNDLNSPLPNFRFKPLLRKAIEMCRHIKELGAALVVAKERKDHETLLALKQTHEGTVHGLVMEQKKTARVEADKAVQALQESRKAPEYRMKHNLQLLGEDLGSIPSVGDIESEFKELADKIEAPVVESGMKLIAAEKEDLQKLAEGLNLKPLINAVETVASELHILPVLNAHASPFGVGVASCWGPPNIAQGAQGVAKAYQAVSEFMASQSAKISKVQGFTRATQQRVKEANSTGHEIKNIDRQIATQQVHVAVHDAEITAHEKTMDNSKEVQDFLTSKYTGAELYSWLDQQTSDLYYRAYTAAYDLARKAEMAFRYERGLAEAKDPPPFIKFGYWQPQNSGLLCGESLLLSLKELEATYHETRGHDYEVTKHVSLRSVSPLQLLQLRGDAVAEFAVPEVLFDMDFPGQYGRRLKSAALTVRSRGEIGPYDNVNCTLRLLTHKFRSSSLLKSAAAYPETTDADDARFSSTSHVPIEAIATSSPAGDAGVFTLDFSSESERFLPFEGAGAISSWRLELNDELRGFDYDDIVDVVLTLRYTALEGGRKLRDAANLAVRNYVKSVAELSETEGLYAAFDVPRDFPDEWNSASAAGANGALPSGKMVLKGINTRLPEYAKAKAPEKIQAKDVWVATDRMLAPGDVAIRQGSTTLAFSRADGKLGTGDGALSALHSTDGPLFLKDWDVSLGGSISGVKEFWILVRYELKA